MTSQDPWIAVRGRRPDAPKRLFCLPHAGSGAVFYQAWADELPAELDVCRVQLPGRETRFVEPALDHLDQLVPALADALQPYLDRPYGLFGHSMGAITGFALLHELRRRGQRLADVFFASGHRAPQRPHPRPPVATSSDERFLAEVRWMGGTPEEFLQDPEMLDVILPTLRADVNVWETYRYDAPQPLPCDLVVLGGTHDKVATPDELDGWAEQTSGEFSQTVLPGDHFFVESERAAVLDAIRSGLA